MGKLNAEQLRKLTPEDFRVLTAVEMAMRNHEIVPRPVVAQMAQVKHDGITKLLRALCSYKLLSYERSKKFDGYRLTNMGYDFLALNVFQKRGTLSGFGHQIGVGKESNIYIVCDENEQQFVLKLHRLGRTCFRNIKDLRDYHGRRKFASWLYLSRISATKEYAYLKALYDRDFPVPQPIDYNRHCVVMSLVKGTLLTHVMQLEDVEALYDSLMNLIVRFAEYGVIHGDFNEFNIMISETEQPVIIDFPQMMSTSHPNAQMYFDRDVDCIKTFFKRRFNYVSELFPTLEEIEKSHSLDHEVRCSGFSKKMSQEMEQVLEVKSGMGDLSDEEGFEGDSGADDNDLEENDAEAEQAEAANDTKQTEKDLLRMPGSMRDNLRISVDKEDEISEDNFSVNLNVSDEEGSDESDRFTNRNSVVTTSTVAPSEIKRRIKKEMLAKAKKEGMKRCKVKGKDSATARGRREVNDAVKWSATSLWGLE